MWLYTHTHTLINGLSDFLTNFKSKNFKKIFDQKKNLVNLKNEEKSFNQNSLKNNFKKEVLCFNSGITLIALIITIIVLLILAGVTIALVVGDNGVLNQAVNAADETNRANVQSELEMAVSAVVADWSGAKYVNGSKETLEDYMTKERVENNMNTADYDLKEFEINVENGTIVGYKGKDYKFTVEITTSGNSAKVIYEGNSEGSSGDDGTVAQIDGSWNEDKKVNSPELMEGMTAIYWDEAGVEHELTEESTKEEWGNWYDYTGEQGTNKWANAVTKDSSGNITGYWVWIPRYAYKIESGLFTSTAGEISVEFLQGTSDLDSEGNPISREYSYTLDETNEVNNHMNDYVVHPAFRDGTSNNFMNGEWDEEVAGFWVAKYEAGYQVNTITNNNGTLSTDISNSSDTVVYSDLKYTSYNSNFETNALEQDLSETGYSNENLSYPVFLPLTYSYNLICIGDSYVLSQSVDTASNFYSLNSSQTDSHMMKNSEWGAVAYLTQSSYGRAGTPITINDYYTNFSSQNLYRTTITGLASSDGSESSTQDLNNVAAYNNTNGYNGNTTGNITGVYDLSGGSWERTSGYILNGNENLTSNGTNSTHGSSGTLMEATSIANANGYQSLSVRNYTVYPYNSSNDNYANNYNIYKGLLSNAYGYGDAILELSNSGINSTSWNSDYSEFTGMTNTFFNYGGGFGVGSYAGLFAFNHTSGGSEYGCGFRVVLVNE